MEITPLHKRLLLIMLIISITVMCSIWVKATDSTNPSDYIYYNDSITNTAQNLFRITTNVFSCFYNLTSISDYNTNIDFYISNDGSTSLTKTGFCMHTTCSGDYWNYVKNRGASTNFIGGLNNILYYGTMEYNFTSGIVNYTLYNQNMTLRSNLTITGQNTETWKNFTFYNAIGTVTTKVYCWNGSLAQRPQEPVASYATTLINKTPEDLNITNAINIGVKIYYNISSSDKSAFIVNQSYLYFKSNYNDTSCYAFINGTCSANDYYGVNYTALYNRTDSYTAYYLLEDNAFYPASYILSPGIFENNNSHIPYNLQSNPDVAGCYIKNISSVKTHSFVEIMANSSTGSANFYACNSSYTTGAISTSPFCTVIGSSGVTPSYNHCHKDNSSCHNVYTILINTSSGTINTVKITNTMQFYIKTNPGSNWNIWGVNNTAYPGACRYSGNSGSSWNNAVNPATYDIHIHQYNGSEYFQMYNNVTIYTEANKLSIVSSDALDIVLLPPTANTITHPLDVDKGYYKGNLNITWNPFTAQSPAYITFYNVTLLNTDFTINMTIDNTTLTYLLFDTTLVPSNNEFYIKVTGYDNNSYSTFSISSLFEVDNQPPILSILPVNGTNFSLGGTYDVNMTCIDDNADDICYNLFINGAFNSWDCDSPVIGTGYTSYIVTLVIGDNATGDNITFISNCTDKADTYNYNDVLYHVINTTVPGLPGNVTYGSLTPGVCPTDIPGMMLIIFLFGILISLLIINEAFIKLPFLGLIAGFGFMGLSWTIWGCSWIFGVLLLFFGIGVMFYELR